MKFRGVIPLKNSDSSWWKKDSYGLINHHLAGDVSEQTDCRWGKLCFREDLSKTCMFLGLFPNNVHLRPFTSDLLENSFSSYRISSLFLKVFLFSIFCLFVFSFGAKIFKSALSFLKRLFLSYVMLPIL